MVGVLDTTDRDCQLDLNCPMVIISPHYGEIETVPGNTLTFELGGEVKIDDLENGVARFRRLVSALATGVAVTWVVEDLYAGSATITIRAESSDDAGIERILEEYASVGHSLSEGEPLQFTQNSVTKAVNDIALLAESHEYVRFETPYTDYTIYRNGTSLKKFDSPRSAIGVVTGTVQTLSSRARLRFNLYDTIHDKSVSCYLNPGQEELMREAWGRQARVTGTVSREAGSGRPTVIRNILKVELLDEVQPGSYKLAKGAVPWQPGDISPEEAIRRIRDR